MSDYDMTEFEAEWITCLYESPIPAISAWREDGHPDGSRYVVRQVEGVYVPREWIGAAMRSLPEAVAEAGAFLLELEAGPNPLGELAGDC